MVEIGKFHLVVEYNVDKTIKIGQGMIRTIGMTLGEEISDLRFTEDRITKLDVEDIMVMKIMKEVEKDLENRPSSSRNGPKSRKSRIFFSKK